MLTHLNYLYINADWFKMSYFVVYRIPYRSIKKDTFQYKGFLNDAKIVKNYPVFSAIT